MSERYSISRKYEVINLLSSILAQFNELLLVVCGVRHTSYNQSICKILIFSAVFAGLDQRSHNEALVSVGVKTDNIMV